MSNAIDSLQGFNFNTFEKEAMEKLKCGQSLTGKYGVLAPLRIPLNSIIVALRPPTSHYHYVT